MKNEPGNKYDPSKHHRRSIRLKGYDYARAGAYFFTSCVRHRECLLGEVVDGAMVGNAAGRLVQQAWDHLPDRFQNVVLDAFVIMPNHVHGILVIQDLDPGAASGAASGAALGAASSAPTVRRPTLGQIMRAFKSISAIAVNRHLGRSGQQFWQRNYYERIIRNEDELNRARTYIINNPAAWHRDPNNPNRP